MVKFCGWGHRFGRASRAERALVNDRLPGRDHGRAGAINDVVNTAVALAGEADRYHVMHFNGGRDWGFDGVLG